MFLVGLVGSHTISYNPMILYDSTRFYIQSYHFYHPSAILNILVRWDRKILQSYDLDRDFDNHAIYITYVSNNSHICPNNKYGD